MSNFSDAVAHQQDVSAYWESVLEQLIRKLGIPTVERLIAKVRAERASQN